MNPATNGATNFSSTDGCSPPVETNSALRNWFPRWPVLSNPTLIKRAAFVAGIATAALILLPIFLANAQGAEESNSDGDIMNWPGWVIFLMWGLFVLVVFIIALFSGSKCPACGRAYALKSTGKKLEKISGKTDFIKVKCKYCDHTEWAEMPQREDV